MRRLRTRLTEVARSISAKVPFPAHYQLRDRASSGAARNALIALCCILIFAGVVASGRSNLLSLHSDMTYPLLWCKDFFVDQRGVSGWSLPPGPHLFPDMALFIPLYAVLPDAGYACVAYAVLYFAVLSLLLLGVFAELHPRKRKAALGALTAGVFVVALLQQPSYLSVSRWLLFPALHAGPTLMGLALVFLFMKAARSGYRWPLASAMFSISFLGTLSNALIVPQFIIPLLLAAVVLWLLRKLKRRILVTTALLTAAGYAARLLALKVVAWGEFLHVPPLFPYTMDADLLMSSTVAFLKRLPTQWRDTTLLCLALLAWLAASTVFLVRYRRWTKPGDSRRFGSVLFLVVFSLFSVLGTVLAPILVGKYRGGYCMAYMTPLFVLPSFVLAALVTAFDGKLLKLFRGCAFSAILLFGLFTILPPAASLKLSALKLPYPAYVKWLDSVALSRGLKYGYASYWRARLSNALSRVGVQINDVEVTDTLEVFNWIANPRWYLGDRTGTYPEYNFIITDFLPRDVILEKFGEPARIETIAQGGVYGEIFIYDRPEDIGFRNYVRLEAMSVFGKDLFSSVDVPGNLSVFKRDGYCRNAEGNSVLTADEQLDVSLGSTAGSDVMEFAADGDGEYRVSFLVGDRLIARVDVPSVPGSGLQRRYVRLPDEVAGRGFDRLLIEAISGGGRHSVGHIFFYKDTYGTAPSQDWPLS